MPPVSPEIAVVQVWHANLNNGEIDRLMTTMSEDVEFGGPRGAGKGATVVHDWAGRAGIQMLPERWFQGHGAVVVAQQARWRDPETGELGAPIALVSAFWLRDGLIQRVVRYDTLADALTAAGLNEAAEVRAAS